MLGIAKYLVRKTPAGTMIKGRYQAANPVEVEMSISIQPATDAESRDILAGGERDVQVYKGYIYLSEGSISQISKRLQTPADEVFYDNSWWTVVSSNPTTVGSNPHTKFLMTRVF